jgi:hypothetical protein
MKYFRLFNSLQSEPLITNVFVLPQATRVEIEKIDNLFQVDINRREQGCAAHYEQYCQHVVTALFNCTEQLGTTWLTICS